MNKTYFVTHCHDHFSMLDGLSKPEQIAERIKGLDLAGCCITNHGSVSGIIDFLKEMKKVDKKGVIGCELYISEFDATIKNENNRKLTHLLVLAKNNIGWKNLIKIISLSNHPDNFYYKNRLSLEQLKPYTEGLIAFSGHLGSTLASVITNYDNDLYANALEKGIEHAQLLRSMFADGDFYLECQLLNKEHLPLVNIIRDIGKQLNIKCIGTCDAHYAYPDQYEDQHVLLATNLNKTIYQCSAPEFGMSGFFQCKNYYIPSYDEMIAFGNTEEELTNTLEIAEKCEEYTNILGPPILPPFKTPNKETPSELFISLCQDGWNRKILPLIDEKDLPVYKDRLDEELQVLQDAGLASYFLIIWDILNYVRNQGWLPGPGRGSASGCLISYLLDITQVDPIKYNLVFERFYSKGRNLKSSVSFEEFSYNKFVFGV